jgi:hypothetical protein
MVRSLEILPRWGRSTNLAEARDIERRAIPKCAMLAVPPPAWKLGFDQPCRSVNRARHTWGSQAKCTLELAVEFRRATGSGVDFLQKFPQVHFRHPLWPNRCELCSTLLTVVLITARWRSKYRVEAEGLDVPFQPLARLAQNEELGCPGSEARGRRRME